MLWMTNVYRPAALALALVLVLPAVVVASDSGSVFDIQCACYANRKNAARLVERLQALDLPWYSRSMNLCTRFILDVNIGPSGFSAFVQSHPEFADAFPVRNYWDLPLARQESPELPAKDEFVAIMAPYMQQQYYHGYYNRKRLTMAEERAQMYTRFIYEAATYYGLDPFVLFAIGNFETYFRNMFGDLDRWPDPAQGMFQILKSTARRIHKDMKRKGVPHAPEEPPEDLRTHPKTQIYYAAHYLHLLQMKHHGNLCMALLAYNSEDNPNYDYPRLVMRFRDRALRFYRQRVELQATDQSATEFAEKDGGQTRQ